MVTNNSDQIVYVFDKGLIYNSLISKNVKNNESVTKEYTDLNKYINIKFVSFISDNIPDKIEVVYYK